MYHFSEGYFEFVHWKWEFIHLSQLHMKRLIFHQTDYLHKSKQIQNTEQLVEDTKNWKKQHCQYESRICQQLFMDGFLN